MWLSADQSLLFTSSGTYYNTSDLSYQGTLGLTTPILALTNSTTASEVDVLLNTTSPYTYPPVTTYPNSYKRYTGSLLFPSTDGQLPLVANQQAYGLNMFYSSSDKHVIVAQTGGSTATASGLQYYVIVR